MTAERRMLRLIVGVPRQPHEDWVDYIQRSTHRSESLSKKHGATVRVRPQRARTWSLAGKAAASTDQRWIQRLLDWKPWFRTPTHRSVGHPHKRWDDSLVALVGGDWEQAVGNPAVWIAWARLLSMVHSDLHNHGARQPCWSIGASHQQLLDEPGAIFC